MSFEEVLAFLVETDREFPTPLSAHIDLQEYAGKLSAFSDFAVCRDHGEIVGMISCYTNRPPDGYISNICIKKDYQGKGIFSKLLALLKENLRQKGVCNLSLQVERINTKAISVYRHSGFEWQDSDPESPKAFMILSL